MHVLHIERSWAVGLAVFWAMFGAWRLYLGDAQLGGVDLVVSALTLGVCFIPSVWWSLIGMAVQLAGLLGVAWLGRPDVLVFVPMAVIVGAWMGGRRSLALWIPLGLAAIPMIEPLASQLYMGVAVGLCALLGSEGHRRHAEAEHRSDKHANFLEDKNRELEGSRRALEESLRLRSAFMANMSHEIRTPLNGVLAMARLLLDTSLDSAQEEMAQTIDRSGRMLLALLNDVLDWSKIESGHLELEQVRFNPREVAEEVLELFSGAAHETDIDLAVVFGQQMPVRAVGDAARLRQVLANLVGNAVKFTDEGGVRVAGSLEGRHLRFEVYDTGVGIPHERMSRLFRPFVQADVSTSRQFGGTGLGLAVSKRLVEAMGGEIGVDSTPGEGSTFWFTVKWEPPTDDTATLTLITRLKRRRVLGVGLRPFTAEGVHASLSEVGCEFEAVDDIAAAASILEEERFHVLLVSARLGEVADLGEQLAALDAPPRVLLAQLGGSTASASEAGFAGVAFAPVRGRDLALVIDAAISGERGSERTAWSYFEQSLAERVPLSILVAEDNPTNQRVVELVLTRLGYAPDFAANGLEAVQAVQRSAYDLVLMDVLMPTMDGLEATRRILELSDGSAPTIVGLTASASAQARRECALAGMSEVLPKPLEIEALVATLESFAPEGSEPPLGEVATDQEKRAANALEMLLQLCGGDEAKRRKLVDDFLDNAHELLEQMRRALETDNADELRRAAHSLKGSSPMYGAPALGAAAGKLESTVKESGLDGAKRGVVIVEDELREAQDTLRKLTEPA